MPFESPAAIARRQFAENLPWYREAQTELQAREAGRAPANWPEPCRLCGAVWRLTPGGRWLIDHDAAGHRQR